jgi:hypothetical protein
MTTDIYRTLSAARTLISNPECWTQECRIDEDGDAKFYDSQEEPHADYTIKIDQRFNDCDFFFEVLREDEAKRQADIKTEEKAKALERIKKSLAHAQPTVEELARELKDASK